MGVNVKSFVRIFSTVLVFLSASITLARAQPPASTPVSEVSATEKTKALENPSKMHDVLSLLLGTWDYTVTVWLSPDSKPEHSTGTAVNDIILGGRFISGKATGILRADDNFMPFEGQILIGYDNFKKEFTSVRVDTLSTGMMIGSGRYDEREKSIKETGHFTNSVKGRDQTYRSDLFLTDGDTYKYVVYTTDRSGKEFKSMEIEYHKKM